MCVWLSIASTLNRERTLLGATWHCTHVCAIDQRHMVYIYIYVCGCVAAVLSNPYLSVSLVGKYIYIYDEPHLCICTLVNDHLTMNV